MLEYMKNNEASLVLSSQCPSLCNFRLAHYPVRIKTTVGKVIISGAYLRIAFQWRGEQGPRCVLTCAKLLCCHPQEQAHV